MSKEQTLYDLEVKTSLKLCIDRMKEIQETSNSLLFGCIDDLECKENEYDDYFYIQELRAVENMIMLERIFINNISEFLKTGNIEPLQETLNI